MDIRSSLIGCLLLVSSIFGRAIEWGLAENNPAKGIRRNRETSRARFLQADELPRFFEAVATEASEAVRDYVLLSLLTGARRENVISMRWKDISLTQSRVGNPANQERYGADNPTVGRGGRRPSRAVNETLRVLPLYFRETGKSGHLVEPKKGWQQVLARAGIENLRLHDLRRSLGSWQAKTGASLAVIGKSLHHKNTQTTAIYARLDLDPVRDAVGRATAAMYSAGGVKPAPKIVLVRSRPRK